MESSEIQIQSPLPGVGTSIFTTMSQLARDEKALSLAQGFPDFDAPPELVERVGHYTRKGYNQYAPSDGVPALRKAIARTFGEAYTRDIDPFSEVTITSGATEAIMASVTALIGQGDEVIIFDPAYDSYDPVVRLNGGVPVHIDLIPGSYQIDWQKLGNALNTKTRAIIINSPHNPTGAVLSEEDLLRLQNIVCDHELFLISDEVYHHIMFDGLAHQSILRFNDLMKRSVAVFSFGKIVHATGWKMGFAIAPPYLTEEIRKVHQFLTFSVHTPTQYALTDHLNEGIDFKELSAFFQEKRDVFLQHLDNPKFTVIPSLGTYFQLLSYDFDIPDHELAVRMTKEYKLASIPISVFNADGRDDHVLRFCFAKENDTLKEAAKILNTVNYE